MRSFVVCLVTLVSGIAVAGEGAHVKLKGYAEYLKEDVLIVEGQRVVANRHTKIKGSGVYTIHDIPLGYAVKVDGHRQRDGKVLASKIEAKPNGNSLYEDDVVNQANQVEKMWVDAGEMFIPGRGKRRSVGKIVETGPGVERVQRIMARLLPPYLDVTDVRVRVVETKEWNASAMPNGAVWVYSGLLHDMSDNELAIILGHELAHFTYEHSRRGMKKGLFSQIVGVAGAIGASTLDNPAARNAANLGASLGATAWQSGYSRDFEDQADRVGLRYAYEAGYDVSKGPQLWEKFREKYGEQSTMANFLYGSHSRPTDRIRNIERELRLNYTDTSN